MTPTVILIRHAQALHNYELHDPVLSDLGYGLQCQELSKNLQETLPIAQDIELIITSPARRTIQTTHQGLGFLIGRGVPVILRPEWQENSSKPCDTGSPIQVMQKEWPQLEWGAVDPVYPSKEGLYAFSKEALTQRGIAARKWLRNRPEKVIAVVSHSGFLRAGVSNKGYHNADYRIFEFEEGNEEIGGKLIEWELTEKKGGGLGLSGHGFYYLSPGDYPEENETPVEELANGKSA